jgi:hypothetical protein
MTTECNTQELQKKISGYLESLMLDTDQARKSEAMSKYLEFAARFHQYSACNVMLILLSKPNATHVAGYESWKKMGRFVKRGEKAISIFAPLLHRENPDNDVSPMILNGFRIVHVFDVSQTDGKPLPHIPNWRSPEKNAELNEKLIRFAESKGIHVLFKDLPGDIQGVSKGGLIEIDFQAGTKTIIHEITHELLHRDSVIPSNHARRELQAEATAFVVSKHFQLSGLMSSNYLALHNLTQKDILIDIGVIQETAKMIINAITE